MSSSFNDDDFGMVEVGDLQPITMKQRRLWQRSCFVVACLRWQLIVLVAMITALPATAAHSDSRISEENFVPLKYLFNPRVITFSTYPSFSVAQLLSKQDDDKVYTGKKVDHPSKIDFSRTFGKLIQMFPESDRILMNPASSLSGFYPMGNREHLIVTSLIDKNSPNNTSKVVRVQNFRPSNDEIADCTYSLFADYDKVISENRLILHRVQYVPNPQSSVFSTFFCELGGLIYSHGGRPIFTDRDLTEIDERELGAANCVLLTYLRHRVYQLKHRSGPSRFSGSQEMKKFLEFYARDTQPEFLGRCIDTVTYATGVAAK